MSQLTDATEFWHERAAVREFDGGAPRDEAEAMALGDVALHCGWDVAVQCLHGEDDGQAPKP